MIKDTISDAIEEKLGKDIKVRMCASWKNLPGYYLKSERGLARFSGAADDRASILWQCLQNEDLTYRLQSRLDSNQCLAIREGDGQAIVAEYDPSDSLQKFKIEAGWSYRT